MESLLGDGGITSVHPLSGILPPTASHMVFPPDNSDDLSLPPSITQKGIQGHLVKRAAELERLALKADALRARLTPQPCYTEADALHILAILSRSQMSRVYKACLYYERNWIAAATFVSWQRYHFNKPQLTHEQGHMTSDSDCEMARCQLSHISENQVFMDPTGDHACGCPSTFGTRNTVHNDTRDTICEAAAAATAITNNHPDTSHLLMDQYNRDELRLLFPATNSTAIRERRDTYANILRELASPNLSSSYRADLQHREVLMRQNIEEDLKGLEIDATLASANRSHPDELWVDFALIHPTARSRLKQNGDWFAREAEEEIKTYQESLCVENSFNRVPSLAVQQYETTKVKKYFPLMHTAQLQASRHIRKGVPEFVPCVFSHTGEFSPGAFKIIEWIARRARESPQADLGHLPPAKRAAHARTTTKDFMACQIARAVGASLRVAGKLLHRKSPRKPPLLRATPNSGNSAALRDVRTSAVSLLTSVFRTISSAQSAAQITQNMTT